MDGSAAYADYIPQGCETTLLRDLSASFPRMGAVPKRSEQVGVVETKRSENRGLVYMGTPQNDPWESVTDD